ncbi:hypothetical protein [Leptolyngbya ohadii]|uniref:hypothetical protein n=1 Tax=Leptolyngbya ohadii TaxID=1962290 RepID=UPI000B59A768|nr:hypothetical protein [Leptolyngbya ohadii]
MTLAEYNDDALKAGGFLEQIPPLELQCQYFCTKVYSIKGIYFDENAPEKIGQLNDFCDFGIGNDINRIFLKMTNETHSKNLEIWMEEKNAHAPFLITHSKNKKDYKSGCRWYQVWKGQVITHECFCEARRDIANIVNDFEIPYIPLITAQLSSLGNLVRIIHLDTFVYGLMPNGKSIIDFKSIPSAEWSISTGISSADAFGKIASKISTYHPPGERVSKLMYASMQETDDLKVFLFAWMAIEVFINQCYKDCAIDDFPIENVPYNYKDRVNRLFKDRKREFKPTVAQKYAYLSIFKWDFTDTSDYDVFMFAKKVRDNFAHGQKIDLNSLKQLAEAILLLLNKIIANLEN